ncbi:hypothetical protein HHJ55_21845 [Escherichia coli]|nr:hypothetical protein HHJ55_21845 [Escherichia coli]
MNKQICVGCEILIRWSKPLHGITGAEQLISLAVSDGIIFSLTKIMMKKKTARILGSVKRKIPQDFLHIYKCNAFLHIGYSF